MKPTTTSDEQDEADDAPQLTLVQERVLASLREGKTYSEAATDAGITDRTIRRWREGCPHFESALRSQRLAIRESAEAIVASAIPRIVKSLIDIATNSEHPQVLKAAKMMIDLSGSLAPIPLQTDVTEVAKEQLDTKFLRIAQRYD